MANKKLWLGILVIVFAMAACGDEPDPDPDPYTPPQSEPGASASNPIDRVVENTNLGTMTSSASGWRQLLNSINSTGKYINLDLSACTMTGTSFNPDSSVETGKKYIVSIILPNAATDIEAGASSGATYESSFKYFNNLKSISGANIITIGDYSFWCLYNDTDPKNIQSVDFPRATTVGRAAFYGPNLQSINFPQVTTIGNSAFSSCGFKNASFPLVQSIGETAFSSCSYLESISFPASVQLGYSSSSGTYSNPFTGCRNLTSFTVSGSGSLSVIENGKALVRDGTILLAYPSASGTITMNNITALDGKAFGSCNLDSVNFPQVTSIGSETFASCSNIQDVSFPQVTNISSSAFSYCSRLQSASFPLVTTIGSSAFFSCSALVSVSIPMVTNIGALAFRSTGATALSITMGSAAPSLGYNMFDNVRTAKTVRVKVPTGATGYSPFSSSSVTVSGTNTDANWANGFRGGSWNGTTWASTTSGGTAAINQNITVIIERQ